MSIRTIVAGTVVVASVLAGPNGSALSTPQACGQTWTIVTSPNPDPQHNALHDVAAVSPNDAWAVGGAFDRTRGSSPP